MKTLTVLHQESDILVLGDAEGHITCCRLTQPVLAEATQVELPLAVEPRPEWMEQMQVQPPYARMRDSLELHPITVEELPDLQLWAAYDRPTDRWFVYDPDSKDRP